MIEIDVATLGFLALGLAAGGIAKGFSGSGLPTVSVASMAIVIDAHAQACDDGNMEIAELLLRALEVQLTAIGGTMVEHRQFSSEHDT